ncbi:MAG: electron transport complex subunit E [Gammaproteobacteria bacterium]|jgi:electron transport complex protein RnfE|nr:electron transport complex subunit E [Gammaproteobacteria bacterium]
MSQADYANISRAGLWTNNPALVQVLGLCPLLAVSNNVINGLGLGLATLLVLTITNGLVSAIRNHTRPEIRIPIYVLVIACVVTSIELAMNAWFHDLYRVLGIFIPLITTNCIVIARAEAFASKNPLLPSLHDGFMMGLGFMLVLVSLGAMRELVGSGTLFANAHLMFGEGARGFTITLFEDYQGFLLAILPPGAFIALGLLIALKNAINARRERRAQAAPEAAQAQAEPGLA